jgi:hypothetical protein
LDDPTANFQKTVAQVYRGVFRRVVLNCLLVGKLKQAGVYDPNEKIDDMYLRWVDFAFEPFPDLDKGHQLPTEAMLRLSYNLLSTRDSLVSTSAMVNPVQQLMLPVLEERTWFQSRRSNQLNDASRSEKQRSELARTSMVDLLRKLQSKAGQSILMISAVHWAYLCIVRSNSDASKPPTESNRWYGHNSFMPLDGVHPDAFFVRRREGQMVPAFVNFARDIVLLQAFFIFHEFCPQYLPQVQVPGAQQWQYCAFALFERTQLIGGALAEAARNVMLPLMEPMRLALPRMLLDEMVRRDATVAMQLLAAYTKNAKEMYRGALVPPSKTSENPTPLPRYYVKFNVPNMDFRSAIKVTFATVLTLAMALTMPDIELCPELSGLHVVRRTAQDVNNSEHVHDSLLPILRPSNLARIPMEMRSADSIVKIWLNDGQNWVSIRYNVSARVRVFGFAGLTIEFYPPLEGALMHSRRGGPGSVDRNENISSDGTKLVITNFDGERKMRKLA